MSKNTHTIGQPIFGYVLNLVDKGAIRRVTKSQQSKRYIKKLDDVPHFITILYAVIGDLESFHEVGISMLTIQPNYLIRVSITVLHVPVWLMQTNNEPVHTLEISTK